MTVYLSVWLCTRVSSSLHGTRTVSLHGTSSFSYYKKYIIQEVARRADSWNMIPLGGHAVILQFVKGLRAGWFCLATQIWPAGRRLLTSGIHLLTGDAGRQWLLTAVSHVVLHCVKRSMNEKEPLLRQRSVIFVTGAVIWSIFFKM